MNFLTTDFGTSDRLTDRTSFIRAWHALAQVGSNMFQQQHSQIGCALALANISFCLCSRPMVQHKCITLESSMENCRAMHLCCTIGPLLYRQEIGIISWVRKGWRTSVSRSICSFWKAGAYSWSPSFSRRESRFSTSSSSFSSCNTSLLSPFWKLSPVTKTLYLRTYRRDRKMKNFPVISNHISFGSCPSPITPIVNIKFPLVQSSSFILDAIAIKKFSINHTSYEKHFENIVWFYIQTAHQTDLLYRGRCWNSCRLFWLFLFHWDITLMCQ